IAVFRKSNKGLNQYFSSV
ncbi:hypothetical protein TNCT_160581, partial [Trichonephila clavata]